MGMLIFQVRAILEPIWLACWNSNPLQIQIEQYLLLKNLFNQKFNQRFFNSYGFENTFAFIVTKETAKKYNLRSISGLKK